MSDSPTWLYLIVALVAFLVGLSKGGLGGSIGALATSLLALVLPAAQVLGLLLPILMFADLFAVAMYWRRWNGRLVLLLLPGTVVGVTVGTYLITNVPADLLRTLLGLIILVFALYKIFEQRIIGWITYQSHGWHGLLAGTVAGFSSALAHTGGPPISAYLLMQDLLPRVFLATSALYFMIVNWIKVPYYFNANLFPYERLWQIAWVLPLVPLGVWVGRRAAEKVSKKTFERIIASLLTINALMLILR